MRSFSCFLGKITSLANKFKNPTIALTFDLLNWMDTLLLECQVSVNDFCRFMKHQLRTLEVLCPEKDCGNVCPACPVEDGVLIESFDACFGLPRKKAAGSSVRAPLHGNSVFCSQEEVDSFVETYPTQPKLPKDCNDFKAGDILRSKSQFMALDETGVFGRACRHGFPKQFVNLKHGERIAYSVWMLNDLVEKSHGRNYNIKIMYDIGCLLTKHLRASGQMDLLSKVKLAVPAFHVYGHRVACQLKFSPRRIADFGLSDGEQLERLWSFLRRFSKMTKEMRPSHRIDVLSDAILHYRRHCKDNLVSSLLRNWNKSLECMEASRKNLDDLADKSPVPLTETVIEELASQERQIMCGERPTQEESSSATSDSPISAYVDILRTYYALRNNLCTDGIHDADEVSAITKKIERLDKELTIHERANDIRTRWTPNDENYKSEVDLKNLRRCTEVYDKIKTVCEERLFLLKLKEKYSEGNALSKKLRNQIKKTEKKMKQLLMEYNSSRDQLKEETKRSCQELNFDLIKRQETFNLEDSGTDVTAVPVSIKRHAIEMLNLLKRSEEEKAILSGEMKQMFYHYRNDEAKVSNSINMLSLNDEVNRFEAGSLALLKAEQQILQKRLSQIRDSFKNLVELPDVNYSHPAAENDEDNESGDTDTQSSENI